MALSDYADREFLGWLRQEALGGFRDAKLVTLNLVSAVSLMSLFYSFKSPILRVIVDGYREISLWLWGIVGEIIDIDVSGRVSEMLTFVLILIAIRIRSVVLKAPSLPKKDQVFAIGALPFLLVALASSAFDPGSVAPSQEQEPFVQAGLIAAIILSMIYLFLSERFIWRGRSILPAGLGEFYRRDGVWQTVVIGAGFIVAYLAAAWAFNNTTASSATFILLSIVWVFFALLLSATSFAYVRSTVMTAIICAVLVAFDHLTG